MFLFREPRSLVVNDDMAADLGHKEVRFSSLFLQWLCISKCRIVPWFLKCLSRC